MFGIGGFELFIILIFGFLIFGPDKLPEIAKTVGKGIARFREAQQEMNDTLGGEKLIDLDNPDEPFKNPIETLDRIAKRQEERQAGTSASASSSSAAGAGKASGSQQGTATAESASGEAKAESFTERKARYERERAARKAAEAEAAKVKAEAKAYPSPCHSEQSEESPRSGEPEQTLREDPSPAAQDDNAAAPAPAEGGDV